MFFLILSVGAVEAGANVGDPGVHRSRHIFHPDLVLSNYETVPTATRKAPLELSTGLSAQEIKAGAALTVHWTRFNTGYSTNKPYKMRVVLSTDARLSEDDLVIKEGCGKSIPSLAVQKKQAEQKNRCPWNPEETAVSPRKKGYREIHKNVAILTRWAWKG